MANTINLILTSEDSFNAIKVITNWKSRKLAAFNKEIGTSRQLLQPLALFTESCVNGLSTPLPDAINHMRFTLRKFSKSFNYHLQLAHSTCLYAIDGKLMDKCLSIRNRLIK